MLKKRIIPCFDIMDGRVVKGINFLELKDAGNPIEMASIYAANGADELVFLDITATLENRKTLAELVEKMAAEINIPFTVGGGINSVVDAERIIGSGADKICINSSALKTPMLITEIANRFGSQAVVVAIDTKNINNQWKVFSNGGRIQTDWDATDWAKEAEKLGAGEILLTAMDHDGTKNGYAIDLTNEVSHSVNIPVIASGGAGTMAHLEDLFSRTSATAALAASIFHYGEVEIKALKNYLKLKKINIR